MHKNLIEMSLLFLCLLLAATVGATTYDVRQDGTGNFTAIQGGIDATIDGDMIIVHPGTYYENIEFKGKNIILRSTDAWDRDAVEATVIDGSDNGWVVTFDGTEGQTCVLSGFTITNGRGGISSGSPDGHQRSLATIANCTITENEGYPGAVVYCEGLIQNCIISNNYGYAAGGLMACGGPIVDCCIFGNVSSGYSMVRGGGLSWCNGVITNCTISGNSSSEGGGLCRCWGEINNCIIWGNEAWMSDALDELSASSSPEYSCVRDWHSGGEGNISDDPMFVEGPLGEYYLHPDSPCIDAGGRSAEEAGLSDRTTQADGTPDTGVVDMGYHYPIPAAPVEVEVECSLNADEFAPGDLMQGYLAVENVGAEATVDVYVGFVLPDGSIYSWSDTGIVPGIWPWMGDVTLPEGFSFGPEVVFELMVPGNLQRGVYSYVAAIAPSASPHDFICIDSAQFNIN